MSWWETLSLSLSVPPSFAPCCGKQASVNHVTPSTLSTNPQNPLHSFNWEPVNDWDGGELHNGLLSSFLGDVEGGHWGEDRGLLLLSFRVCSGPVIQRISAPSLLTVSLQISDPDAKWSGLCLEIFCPGSRAAGSAQSMGSCQELACSLWNLRSNYHS